MELWLSVIVIIFIIILSSLIIYYIVLRFNKKETDTENNPIFINLYAQKCNKRAFGKLLDQSEGKDGRFLILYEPRDIDLTKTKDEVKNELSIIDHNKILPIYKGDWSSDKSIVIGLPPTAEDFPESLKKTEFGIAMMMVTELKNAVNSELASVREGSKRKTEILQRMGDGEISTEHLAKVDEIQKDFIKLLMKDKDNKSTSSSNFAPVNKGFGENY